MELTTPHSVTDYLSGCAVINLAHPDIQQQAIRLKQSDDMATAKACFEWVRDNIRHSVDFQDSELTCTASEVLAKGSGYCYAKAHLLVALLRANGIASGLCYQRLSLKGNGEPYCLHGLAAVLLPDLGWYRIDPRGNKPGVDAQFVPPREQLAFATDAVEEIDFATVHAKPLSVVVDALNSDMSVQQLYTCLPDVQPTV